MANADSTDREVSEVVAALREMAQRGRSEEAFDIVEQLLSAVKRENQMQAAKIRELLRKAYGRSSERIDPNQLRLALAGLREDDVSAKPKPAAEGDAPTDPPPRTKKRRGNGGGRRPLPADLPREEIRLTPTDEQVAGKGPMTKVGEERSEVLEYIPAQFKVLVYVRQTGTRDIQDRILKILRDGGVRAEVLTSSVNPRKREEWIARRVFGLDALVVNPKLVQTGLDLIAFASVVFFETEYSLYVLWQSLRRVWRLGQTKPVKAVFSAYNDTMESRALALIGAKMKAAQLLYGDNVGGAIVPEEDGDLLMKLAREALDAAELPDLQALFADEVVVSNSPLGCPTAPSAPLPVPEMPATLSWADWMAQRGTQSGRSRARSQKVSQNQISLF